MQHDHEHYHKPEKKVSWWKTPSGLAFIFFIVIGGYFLIKEHSAHIGNNWIWLILLLCPLMHMFHHGGHGGHGGHGKKKDEGEE